MISNAILAELLKIIEKLEEKGFTKSEAIELIKLAKGGDTE